MKFFDCNAMIGAHFAPRMTGPEREIGGVPGADNLLEEMDFFGIDSALVYHGLAREYSEMVGNRELSQAVAGSDRLHPCWVVSPHHSGECPPPEELLNEMDNHGVRAVRIFVGGPLSYAETVDLVSHAELLAALEERRIPVFLEFERDAGLSGEQVSQLDPLLARYPHLPIVVGASKITAAATRALLARVVQHPHLHVDVSGLHESSAMERFAALAGARCLLYGTRFPWYAGGQARIAVAHADLTSDEKAALSGDNLEALLRGPWQ